MIKPLHFLQTLFLISALSFVSYAKEINFSSYIDGLPLIENFYEDPDSVIIFDKPVGRIIQISGFIENVKIAEIMGFYKSHMHDLGWHEEQNSNNNSNEIFYSREGEFLKIIVNQKDDVLHVDFALTPR